MSMLVAKSQLSIHLLSIDKVIDILIILFHDVPTDACWIKSLK